MMMIIRLVIYIVSEINNDSVFTSGHGTTLLMIQCSNVQQGTLLIYYVRLREVRAATRILHGGGSNLYL